MVFYLAVAVAVFGHAWTRHPPERMNTINKQFYPTDDGDRFFAGAAAGAAWPLYLSIKFWEAQR